MDALYACFYAQTCLRLRGALEQQRLQQSPLDPERLFQARAGGRAGRRTYPPRHGLPPRSAPRLPLLRSAAPRPALIWDNHFLHVDVGISPDGPDLFATRLMYILSKRPAVYATAGHICNRGSAALPVDAGTRIGAAMSPTSVATGIRISFRAGADAADELRDGSRQFLRRSKQRPMPVPGRRCSAAVLILGSRLACSVAGVWTRSSSPPRTWTGTLIAVTAAVTFCGSAMTPLPGCHHAGCLR